MFILFAHVFKLLLIMRLVFLISDFSQCRLVVPPIYPGVGGDDLFPGPGAGMYPSRFFPLPYLFH